MEEQILKVFENRVLSTVFAPTKRTLHAEPQNLYSSQYILGWWNRGKLDGRDM